MDESKDRVLKSIFYTLVHMCTDLETHVRFDEDFVFLKL
uniref:Uncharacterized protein n=1 Tax=Spodoptera exigua multiple nucleopolyhedrovirus TaxID=10454 RepID=A0A6N0C8B8_9ABAC|nr:hypothetical protein [Spodoptera exigua multiple nucleopolyhedrovirus]